MKLNLNLRNPNTQQAIMEFFFPLLGYFFWDWSIVTIIIFYLLDWVASQIMYTKRLYTVKSQFNQKLNWILPFSISFCTILITSASSIIYLLFKTFDNPKLGKDLNLELLIFLKTELWYLLPLIILSYYAIDKFLFYTPKLYTNYSARPYLYKNIKANSIAFILVVTGTIIYPFINISEILTIITIAFTKLIFDTFIKEKLKNRIEK